MSTEPQQAEPDSGRKYIQREQPVRPLSRLFAFPADIDTDNVRTMLENGILKIHVPKAAVGHVYEASFGGDFLFHLRFDSETSQRVIVSASLRGV